MANVNRYYQYLDFYVWAVDLFAKCSSISEEQASAKGKFKPVNIDGIHRNMTLM